MAHILISSADQLRAEQWKAALTADHKISLINDFNKVGAYLTNGNAIILIVDGDQTEFDFNTLTSLIQPQLKILIIGHKWPDHQQIKALISGCSGYCETDTSNKLLHKAINHLLKGDIWIQRHLVPQVIKELTRLNQKKRTAQTLQTQDNAKKLAMLSGRELEVANLIKAGESNKRIARILNISERTVKAHLTSIFNKLDMSDRLHLAIFLKETTTSN